MFEGNGADVGQFAGDESWEALQTGPSCKLSSIVWVFFNVSRAQVCNLQVALGLDENALEDYFEFPIVSIIQAHRSHPAPQLHDHFFFRPRPAGFRLAP